MIDPMRGLAETGTHLAPGMAPKDFRGVRIIASQLEPPNAIEPLPFSLPCGRIRPMTRRTLSPGAGGGCGARVHPAGRFLVTAGLVMRGRRQSESWEARSTTWSYSVLILAGEMLVGKAIIRPVARSTTQNEPPLTCASLIHCSRTNHPSGNSSRCHPRPPVAVAGPMISLAMRCASSLVIISRDLPVCGEVDGVGVRHLGLIEAQSVPRRGPVLESGALAVDREDRS